MRTWAQIPSHHRGTYKDCPGCGRPCAKKASACRSCSTRIPRGENHYAWKGDAALPTTKRLRAQARYELGDCESCGAQATDRHHKDGDTGNNVPENIAILCRRCHMTIDGRLAQRDANGRFSREVAA